ncbi:MAG: PaaI family thioesterase [Proteobacteria bacterium]|nr:PaaI family thioesterase [Pseudomonadota bacterium]
MESLPSVESVQALLTRGPFHQWLGLQVQRVGDGEIEIKATWRPEWVVNPDAGYTHGGILAALIDLCADWALVSTTGRGVPTIDMRVDYHRAAMKGDIVCKGKVVKGGKQFSVCEASLFNEQGQLLASGRGVYAMPAPKSA